jgi:hypothetical protein
MMVCYDRWMTTLSLKEAGEKWDRFFTETQSSIFKAEVLQDYSAIDDGPSWQAWQRGDKAESLRLDQEDPDLQEWIQKCKEKELTIQLVHVVDNPLTNYMQWEIETAYKGIFIPSGAYDISLVDRATVPNLALPDGDFWIFDSERVVKWNYEGAKGKCVSGTVYEKGDDIEIFLHAKKELLKAAEAVK